MRKAISVGIAVAIVMLICAMTTDYKVEKNAEVNIYQGEIFLQRANVFISGHIKKHILSKEQEFVGVFSIDGYERTHRAGTEARIKWINEDEQYITFYNGANSSFMGIESIKIDKKMQNITIVFKDETIK